ncbi:MAG: site-2 protease family protein [candidate division Zixibacteria bacterium]|nr:site-2 protease family protein [candidate division Zixibacteria bacterium]
MDDFFRRAILFAPIIIFSLTVHEFFHAWTANKFGDPTAKDMGRLTLNPLKHLDVMGTMMFFVTQFRFGWAKPVPVNPYNLRNYRHDNLWISAAGPLSNLGLAVIFGTIFRIGNSMGLIGIYDAVDLMLFYAILINVSLALFNLLPIFPLDGSHILKSLLPERFTPMLQQVEKVAPMILMVVIFLGLITGRSIIWVVLGPFISLIVKLVSGINF